MQVCVIGALLFLVKGSLFAFLSLVGLSNYSYSIRYYIANVFQSLCKMYLDLSKDAHSQTTIQHLKVVATFLYDPVQYSASRETVIFDSLDSTH